MATLVQFDTENGIIFNLDRVKYISFTPVMGYCGPQKEWGEKIEICIHFDDEEFRYETVYEPLEEVAEKIMQKIKNDTRWMKGE